MKMWLVGAGYWGSKIKAGLDRFGVDAHIIDIRNGQSINDINDTSPVMLATPLWNHYEQTLQLLNSGHDLYVEKPLAETAAQIQQIQNVKSPDQLLMVGHIFIHHPQMEQIKTIIAAGTIGDVQHINSRRLNWGIYQTKTTPTLSLATHDISIVLELAGQDATIESAQGWNLTNNPAVWDRVYFEGQTSQGISFDIDVSWAWPVRTRQTIIHGTRGQIIWDQDANTVTVAGNGIWENRAIEGHTVCHEYASELTPLDHELKHWIDCVQTRHAPSTGVDEALAVARVIGQVDRWIGTGP